MIAGISLVVFAAVLQGIFLLPMSRTRRWEWEHNWLAFSITGMLVCNWVLTLIFLPAPAAIYSAVPRQELAVLAGFGVAWGAGAVLFGLGMDMLGLTLGYPLIMGLNASVGTFAPLLWRYGGAMFAGRRLFIAAGTAVAIIGIAACSVAGARRASAISRAQGASQLRFFAGLTMAVVSGFLSCLPNIGLTFGADTVRAARNLGASCRTRRRFSVVHLLHIWRVGQCSLLLLADDSPSEFPGTDRGRQPGQLVVGSGHGGDVDRQLLYLRDWHAATRFQWRIDRLADSRIGLDWSRSPMWHRKRRMETRSSQRQSPSLGGLGIHYPGCLYHSFWHKLALGSARRRTWR